MQTRQWYWQMEVSGATGNDPGKRGFWTQSPDRRGIYRLASADESAKLNQADWPPLTAFARSIDRAIEL